MPCNHPMYWSGGKKPAHTNMWNHLKKVHGIGKINDKTMLAKCGGKDMIKHLDKVCYVIVII